MKKTTYNLFAFGAIAFAFTAMLASCVKDNPDSPGYEYMPDMYRSPSIETNGVNMWVKDSTHMGNMLPPLGTIPIGFTPFPYPNTPDGDTLAMKYWDSPLEHSDKIEEEGKALYERFCIYCHGPKGDGKGKLVTEGKFTSPPPSYLDLYKTQYGLSDGHIYHVITYGKNNMGSHASQISPEERWKIIEYVERLGRGGESWSAMLAKAPKAGVDSTNVKPVGDTTKHK